MRTNRNLISFACGVFLTASLGAAYVWSVNYRWQCEAADHNAAIWYWEPQDLRTSTIRWDWADDFYAKHPQRLKGELRKKIDKMLQRPRQEPQPSPSETI